MSARFAQGQYTGTGSSLNIEVGFVPDYVQITNYTDGNNFVIWSSLMTAATSVDIAAATASNAAGSVSAYVGAAGTTAAGFSTGADNSTSAKVYIWQAWKAA